MEIAAHLFRETRQRVSVPQSQHNIGQQRSGAVLCAAGLVSPTPSVWWTQLVTWKIGKIEEKTLMSFTSTLYPTPLAECCTHYSTNHLKSAKKHRWPTLSNLICDEQPNLTSSSIWFPVTPASEASGTPTLPSYPPLPTHDLSLLFPAHPWPSHHIPKWCFHNPGAHPTAPLCD